MNIPRRLWLLSAPLFVSPVHAEMMMFGHIDVQRLEYAFDPDRTLLDLDADYGGDTHRFVTKFDGEQEKSESEYELQLLYSRAVSPYFDLQVGFEFADGGDDDDAGLVAGFEGMAPYRIELDAAAILTENGDVQIRTEFERDFLLTQNWALQPRVQVDFGNGTDTTAVELRTRYEFTRKFAPYVGIAWRRVSGDRTDRVAPAGGHTSDATLVAGLSFWF